MSSEKRTDFGIQPMRRQSSFNHEQVFSGRVGKATGKKTIDSSQKSNTNEGICDSKENETEMKQG